MMYPLARPWPCNPLHPALSQLQDYAPHQNRWSLPYFHVFHGFLYSVDLSNFSSCESFRSPSPSCSNHLDGRSQPSSKATSSVPFAICISLLLITAQNTRAPEFHPGRPQFLASESETTLPPPIPTMRLGLHRTPKVLLRINSIEC